MLWGKMMQSRDNLLIVIAITFLAQSNAIAQTAAIPAARVFAPGVISGPDADIAPAFTPSGDTLYFSRNTENTFSILVSYRQPDNWTIPVVASFSGRWNDLEVAIAPSGKYVVFASDRPAPGTVVPLTTHYHGKEQRGGALWRVSIEKGQLGEPALLPPSVNQGSSNWTPAIAGNNALYFMRTDIGSGRFRLFRSAYNGEYAQAEPLSFSTGEFNDVDPVVDPSERFIIFSSDRAAPGVAPNPGPERLFIAFNPTSAKALICPIVIPGWTNLSESQVEARLSPDGRQLYFASRHPDHQANDPPAGPWDNGKANIWEIPLLSSLWRNVERTDTACKSKS